MAEVIALDATQKRTFLVQFRINTKEFFPFRIFNRLVDVPHLARHANRPLLVIRDKNHGLLAHDATLLVSHTLQYSALLYKFTVRFK